MQGMCGQGNPGEQPEESRCGAGDGPIRPLALSFYSQVRAHFLEGDLQLPTQHEPVDDLDRIDTEVGAEQSLGLKLPEGVSDRDPASGGRPLAQVVPDSGIGGDR